MYARTVLIRNNDWVGSRHATSTQNVRDYALHLFELRLSRLCRRDRAARDAERTAGRGLFSRSAVTGFSTGSVARQRNDLSGLNGRCHPGDGEKYQQ